MCVRACVVMIVNYIYMCLYLHTERSVVNGARKGITAVQKRKEKTRKRKEDGAEITLGDKYKVDHLFLREKKTEQLYGRMACL